MIDISDVISIQSLADRKLFVADLNRRNKRHDTRNVALYKAYLNGSEKEIRDEIGANAFNALKKRLTDQLIEFTSARLLTHDFSSENDVIKLVVLSRKLLIQNKIKTGFTLLLKAEKKALSLDNFTLLNEIYHTLIEYSHLTNRVEQKELFLKLELNNKRFLAEERLSVLYASMKKQFISAGHGVISISLQDLYKDGLQKFGVSNEATLNFKSLNQLCVLTDLYATQTKSFHDLDLFFEDSIQTIQGSEKDNEHTLGYHIELLYGMANIYFRKKNLKKSLIYLDQMEEQMIRFNQKHYSEWLARFVNLKALNLNFSGLYEEARSLLETTLQEVDLKEEEEGLLKLNLAMIHFQHNRLAEVKSLINSLYRSDNWYLNKMGNEWLFNLKAMEIVLHLDLGNDQLAESRLLSLQRKLPKEIKHDKQNPLWPFIGLVKTILFNTAVVRTEAFAERVEYTIPWKGEEEDIFNVCFYGWLKAKMINQPIYETTLEILKAVSST